MIRQVARSRSKSRPGPRRATLRPTVEPLEGRALLSAGLDSSFGTDGQVDGTFGSTGLYGAPSAVAVQPDGKILVAGTRPSGFMNNDVVVERFDVDGSVDTTFGTAGVAVALPYADSTEVANKILIQPDGKIVLAAFTDNFATKVFRLNPDGSPDTSFGQDGIYSTSVTPYVVRSVALQSDGKIVLVGTGPGGTFYVQRLDPDGEPDPDFGSGGLDDIPEALISASSDTSDEFASAYSVAIQPDGKIIFVGDAEMGSIVTGTFRTQAQAFRLDPDGTLDTSFGNGGLVVGPSNLYGGFDSVAIQADGQVDLTSLAEPTSTQLGYLEVVIQVNPDGSSSPSYAGTISSFSGTPAGSQYTPTSAIDAEGRVVIVDGGSEFATARLTANGADDASFGPGGVLDVTSDLAAKAPDPDAGPDPLAIAPDGKIVVVATGTGGLITFGFTLIRLDPGQTPGDYLGAGQSDAAIELPNLGVVAIRPSNGAADEIIPFGISGAGNTLPAPGDYDGSGRTELGVYLPKLGEFAYRPSDGGPDVQVPFGFAGAGQTIPAPADYAGTGQSDIAAYLPSLGEFAIRPPTGPDELVSFGIAGAGGSIPAPGDYEGTGVDDIAVYLPSIGAYAIRPSTGGADEIIPFGIAGAGQSIPVPGDYDGSGKTELAVYLPSFGEFTYRPANGGADVIIPFGLAGSGQTLPMPGDYDGSGKTELAVYLPSLGDFAYRPSSGPDVIEGFGIAGQSIPFTTNPPSNTLPASLTAASVSAESVSWIDVAPVATKPRKPTDVPVLG